MTNVEREEKRAKQLLFDLGYVVIPRERHRVLTVDRRVSAWVIENLRDKEQLESYRRFEEDTAARALGHELMKKAVLKEDLGYDSYDNSYRRRWSAGVIIPRSNSFEST